MEVSEEQRIGCDDDEMARRSEEFTRKALASIELLQNYREGLEIKRADAASRFGAAKLQGLIAEHQEMVRNGELVIQQGGQAGKTLVD